ncbi:hypothetical protein QQP08_006663 [Theobroma cacao]|nr:hypothetical protein QQP08_006663 [Theobroma cacao]
MTLVSVSCYYHTKFSKRVDKGVSLDIHTVRSPAEYLIITGQAGLEFFEICPIGPEMAPKHEQLQPLSIRYLLQSV